MTKKASDVLYDWIKHVQTIIKRHQIVEPVIGERTGEISKGWIFELVMHISSQHKREEHGDGCLWHAFAVGSVLLSWYFRTAFAKTCDPRRPKKERERAIELLISNCETIMNMMKFEIGEKDREIYNQEWQPVLELDYDDFGKIEKQVEEIIERKVA